MNRTSLAEMQTIDQLLRTMKTIAVVGLSSDPMRASYGVAEFLQGQGFRIIPVNPNETEVLGEQAYASLSEIPANIQIDIVDVFRRPEHVPEIVDEVIRRKIPALWLQEGVIHDQAADRARAAGIQFVQDRCLLKEYRAYTRRI